MTNDSYDQLNNGYESRYSRPIKLNFRELKGLPFNYIFTQIFGLITFSTTTAQLSLR